MTGPKRTIQPLLVALVALVLLGAGFLTPADARADRVAITNRAVAAFAADRLPIRVASAGPTFGLLRGTRGADLRFDPSEGDDGDLVRVAVRRGARGPDPCLGADRCVRRTVQGGRIVLSWDLVEPEEDPGYVTVTMVRAGHRTTVSLFGPDIVRDPRTIQTLRPSVRALTLLARNPLLAPRTTRAVVERGREFEPWDLRGAG